jgi:hypothetical protein
MYLFRTIKVKIGELSPIKKTNYELKKNEYLIEEIDKNGYKNNKGKILVDRNLKIIDGHHRTELIIKKYGEGKEVFVNQIFIPQKVFFLFFYIIFLFSPIISFINFIIRDVIFSPIKILKKYFNGFKKNRSRDKRDT